MNEVMRLCEKCKTWVWMPKRDEKCPKCGKHVETTRMKRSEGIQIQPDWKPFISENMGHEPRLINGRAHWREELKRSGRICIG